MAADVTIHSILRYPTPPLHRAVERHSRADTAGLTSIRELFFCGLPRSVHGGGTEYLLRISINGVINLGRLRLRLSPRSWVGVQAFHLRPGGDIA